MKLITQYSYKDTEDTLQSCYESTPCVDAKTIDAMALSFVYKCLPFIGIPGFRMTIESVED